MESTQLSHEKGMKRKLEDQIHGEEELQRQGKKVCPGCLEQESVITEQYDDPEVVEKTLAMIEKYGSIQSSKDKYEILKFLGEGVFGEVAECVKKQTKEVVALKISKKQDKSKFSKECSILRKVNKDNPDKFSFVRNMENFIYKEHFFMVFEILEKSLYHFMVEDDYKPLPMYGIRYVTQQLLVAQLKLWDLGIIHGDLKPENIMLVNHQRKPFKIKVIDFGLSIQLPTSTYSTQLGTLTYRAPEVILGMEYCEAVDMWSTGCIVAEMLVGEELHPGKISYDQIRFIDDVQGPFPNHMVESNKKRAAEFFCRKRGGNSRRPKWRVKKPEEYTLDSGKDSTDFRKYQLSNLDALLLVCSVYRKGYGDKDRDRIYCVDMIKDMLKINPEDRIFPDHALECRFIKGGGLSN